MVARGAAAGVAGLILLLGTALSGCAGAASGTVPAPMVTTPARAAVADSFRSSRTYDAVAMPVRVRIPAAGVDARLERVGRVADGTMGLPSRPGLAGWYGEGPRPGQPGPAVVLGHVDWDHAPAVFFRLTQLRPGDTVHVDRADGSTADFRVTRTERVPKVHFPTQRVYAPDLQPSLRLVTCGGSFDYSTGNYRDNVIVFAVPT